jgi:hypothetical protein
LKAHVYEIRQRQDHRGFDLLSDALPFRSVLLVAVHFDVALGRFTRVMRRMQMVAMCSMRVMCRQFVFAGTVMLGRLAMVLRRVFMVFGGLRVMFFKFLWHSSISRILGVAPPEKHSPTPE